MSSAPVPPGGASVSTPLCSVRGDWLFCSNGEKTIARRFASGESVQLDGLLHESFWGNGSGLVELASISPTFAALAQAWAMPDQKATLGNTLRGGGWGLLFLELTGRCNERCLHCYASSSPEVDTALTLSSIRSILADARDLGFVSIQLTGGDPLISRYFEEALEYAAHLGFERLEVFTNGLAFNDRLADHFKRSKACMAVSMYSHDPAVHDSVTRTPGSHARTARAIQLALASAIPLRVAGVQGCSDQQDERRLREYLLSLGVKEDAIWVDRQRPVGRGQWTMETQLLSKGRGPGHSDKGFPGRGKLSVSYSGNVVPCIFDRGTVLGNVRDMSLKKVLETEVRPDFTRETLKVLGEPLACVDCRERNETLRSLSWKT